MTTEHEHRRRHWWSRARWRATALTVTAVAGVWSVLGTQAAYQWAKLRWHLPERERFAVKCVHADLPLAVLGEIKKTEFSVAQVLALGCVESMGYAEAQNDAKSPTCFGWLQVHQRHAWQRKMAVRDLFNPVVCTRVALEVLSELKAQYEKQYQEQGPDGEMRPCDVEYYYISAYNCGTKKWDQYLRKGNRDLIPDETEKHWQRYQRVKRRLEVLFELGDWVDTPLADWKNKHAL